MNVFFEWIDRATRLWSGLRNERQFLLHALRRAQTSGVLHAESSGMVEGVLRLSDKTAGDVMIAAPRMDLLDINLPLAQLLGQVIDTAHSRFPVFEGEECNIIGVLLAKDLLKLQRAPELNVRALLRPAVFVPESKGLHELLQWFRSNRNHLALVVDEFGVLAGLVTIENVLEQIVGEIEDEFDAQAETDNGDIFLLADHSHRVSGQTPIERVNEAFGAQLPIDAFDTIGGLVAHQLGYVPKKGETIELNGFSLTVLHRKAGAVNWFKLKKNPLVCGPT